VDGREEDQLRRPVDELLEKFGHSQNLVVVAKDESTLDDKQRFQKQQAATATRSRTFQNPQPAFATPASPKCGSAMVRRTAKKGTNAGNEFWGCVSYPQCRGFISIE
jgi:restriction system protein